MSRSILLADDSVTIRKVVEVSFSDTDFHVEAVGDGDEALSRLQSMRPDLVLADVVMPGPTGYEICRRIKASDRPVPVLLLAGTFESFDHDLARECGADGCLLKPFESRTLLDRVTSLLADREAVATSPVEPLAEETSIPVGEPPAEPGAGAEPAAAGLTAEALDAVADAVVRRLSVDVLREIAREVVPEVAEKVVRERIRELEDGDA